MDSQETNNSGGFNWTKLIIPVAILIAGVMVSGAIILSRSGNDSLNKAAVLSGTQYSVDIGSNPFLGNENAPVTIIEFSDFQCPFCRAFWNDTLPEIEKEYINTGKVRLEYRNFPLSIHPNAQMAAEAAECANEQGKFWEMHDKIFSEQEKKGQGTVTFTEQEVVSWAGQIGLNSNTLKSCIDSGKYDSVISQDSKDGNSAGVSGTPTFFIAKKFPLKVDPASISQKASQGQYIIQVDGGMVLIGAQPFSVFKAAIDSQLQSK